jgi:uncharacterized Tic20 family protein
MTKEEKNWAALIHLAAFTGLVIPFGNIFGPMLIWMLKKDSSEFINYHGKEAVNFQLTLTIYFVIAIVLVIILIGIPILLLVFLFSFIFPIIAAIKAAEGEYYLYPLSFNIIN